MLKEEGGMKGKLLFSFIIHHCGLLHFSCSCLVAMCGKVVELLWGCLSILAGVPGSVYSSCKELEASARMRYLNSWSAAIMLVLALSVAVVMGQGPGGTAKKPEQKAPQAPPAQPIPEDGVTRITPAEAQALLEKGTAIIVDVRGEESYRIGHIKGALWMPDIASRTKELPRDKTIITYCSWPAEHSSARAAHDIKERGIEKAAALLGGYTAWVNAGFPTESGAAQTKGK
jgi:rhodanese-related sulfurtransferase